MHEQRLQVQYRDISLCSGQPVLIDFTKSIFSRENFEGEKAGLPVLPRKTGSLLQKIIHGRNPVVQAKSLEFLKLAKISNPHPRILVIGGGTVGVGAEALYEDRSVIVDGTDVYATAHTCLVCDGHRLPFRDGSFEGVWIQAVLEHVLEPHTVADEIHRVLKPDGIVFANTPFMQQVHEGAYDFTRFTLSGHRWLFRRFDEIDAGSSAGSGVALVWAIRYFVRSLGAGRNLSILASLPFFWLQFLGNNSRKRAVADAASGFYFLGRKAESELSPHDMVKYYVTQGLLH